MPTRQARPVRRIRMEALPPDARADLDAARATKAEIDRLEAAAAELRGRLGARLTRLVDVHRVSRRALARALDYRSENSVRFRIKTNQG
ncbi:hypothetical protein ACQSSU_20885 [Micromonospora echinospora]